MTSYPIISKTIVTSSLQDSICHSLRSTGFSLQFFLWESLGLLQPKVKGPEVKKLGVPQLVQKNEQEQRLRLYSQINWALKLVEMLFKLIVVGNTADTPNPPGLLPFFKGNLFRRDSQISLKKRVATQGDLVYRQYCLLPAPKQLI